jgi:EAL domain-containing protein (putative c-di-GMP-specific phosphodiesterase class I)
MRDVDDVVRRLSALKLLGVRLAVDDFGTGYSSLSYLRQFPFDILKIDQSFVRSALESAESIAVVRTLISLGRRLNLQLVAEGVEDEDQFLLLQRLRCHHAQGHLFSRALTPAAFEALRSSGGGLEASAPGPGPSTALRWDTLVG